MLCCVVTGVEFGVLRVCSQEREREKDLIKREYNANIAFFTYLQVIFQIYCCFLLVRSFVGYLVCALCLFVCLFNEISYTCVSTSLLAA